MDTKPEENLFIDERAVRAARAAKQGALLDDILKIGGIKNDAQLSRLTEVSPPVISKLRNGYLPIGASMLIALNEISGRGIRDMKKELGLRVLDRVQGAEIVTPQYHPV